MQGALVGLACGGGVPGAGRCRAGLPKPCWGPGDSVWAVGICGECVGLGSGAGDPNPFWGPGESVLRSGGDRAGGVGDVGSGELASNSNWGPGDSVGEAVGSGVRYTSPGYL